MESVVGMNESEEAMPYLNPHPLPERERQKRLRRMLSNTYLSLEVAALLPHSPGLVKMRGLEADCELCSQQVVVVARAGRFVLKAVL